MVEDILGETEEVDTIVIRGLQLIMLVWLSKDEIYLDWERM